MAKKKQAETIETDVLIIGGGLAGLTAAVGLRKSGLRVHIIERDTILGGRARSWIDAKTGDPVHIGPHIFISEYPNMRALMSILGTEDKIVWEKGRFILVVDGQEEIEMKMANLPPPFHYIPSLVRDKSVTKRDLLSNLPITFLAMRLTEEDVLRLDNINASAFLRGKGVTENFIQRFWSFAAMSIMNVPLELCSAGALLRFYRQLVGHNDYYAGFPDGGLGDVFAPQAKELIESHGGEIWLDTEVDQILGDERRATGCRLADGRSIQARFVVAALPPSALRSVARPEWLEHYKPFTDLVHFQPVPYISTFLWFDRKLTRQRFWARAHNPNDLNCDFYDLSNINTGWEDRPSVITTNCIFSERAQHLSDEEMVERTIAELAEYLPEAREARLEHFVVNRIPMAIHCPFPGTEQLRPSIHTPVDNLLLAGDWIRTELPSSMESACKSGWMVAEAIWAELGRTTVLHKDLKEVQGLVRLVSRASRYAPLPRLPRWVRSSRRA